MTFYIKKMIVYIISIIIILITSISLCNGIVSINNDYNFNISKGQCIGFYSTLRALQIFIYNEQEFEIDIFVDEGSLDSSDSQVNGVFYMDSVNKYKDRTGESGGLYEIHLYWYFDNYHLEYLEYAYMMILFIQNDQYIGYAVVRAQNVNDNYPLITDTGKYYEVKLIESRIYPKKFFINCNITYDKLIRKSEKIIEADKEKNL